MIVVLGILFACQKPIPPSVETPVAQEARVPAEEPPSTGASLAALPLMSSTAENLAEPEEGETLLNTRQYKYAGYLVRLRRVVSFYWQQNLDELTEGLKLDAVSYTTVIAMTLNAQGDVIGIEVAEGSGVPDLDLAVVGAVRKAGPFPVPPEGFIDEGGEVWLPDFGFTVRVD